MLVGGTLLRRWLPTWAALIGAALFAGVGGAAVGILDEPAAGRGLVLALFARFFLKLADNSGRPDRGGTFIAMPLSRQELADLTGTTIETAIRIMSRWGKQNIVHTEKDGFVNAEVVASLADGLTKAKKTFEFKTYEGVGHAFMNDTRPEAYDAEAAHDAWNRTVDFFRAHLS